MNGARGPRPKESRVTITVTARLPMRCVEAGSLASRLRDELVERLDEVGRVGEQVATG